MCVCGGGINASHSDKRGLLKICESLPCAIEGVTHLN